MRKRISKLCMLIFIFFFYYCTENPIEPKKEPCPGILIATKPPYDSPIWHPNGKIIGFNHIPLDSISYPYGEHCMGVQHFNYDSTGFWLINIDGSDMKRLLPFQLQTPAWSPDGKWVAFVNNEQIFKMPFNVEEQKFDTTRIEQLTFEGRNFFPSWSPNGEWLVYDSNNESQNGMNFIWKMKVDGTEPTRIAYDPTKGEIRAPNWSTTNRIAHIRYIGVGAPEIFSMNIDGMNLHRITFNNVFDYYPKYSFNNVLAFFSSNSNSNRIWIVDTLQNISMLSSSDVSGTFDWSPDGVNIVFTKSNSGYENGVLWVININTKNEYQLTFNKEAIE